MKQAVFLSMLGLGFVTACGAKVVVDAPEDGVGGAGGASSSAQSSVQSSVGISVSSVGPGPIAVSVGPGPTGPGPGNVSSVVTGPGMCDGQGDCSACVQCSIATNCADLWDKCNAFDPCNGLLNCLPQCTDDACFQKCLDVFADGIDLYNATASCIVCKDCFGDCDGASQCGP